MLTWTDLMTNWGFWATRLAARFPQLDVAALAFAKGDRARVEALLAQAHHLSPTEATEAIEDFLLVSSLLDRHTGALTA